MHSWLRNRRLKPVGPSLRLGCPPIQLQGLSGKYASALYSAAIKKDEKIVSTVEKDLSSFQQRWIDHQAVSSQPYPSSK
ncbi:hypothetical protein H4Q26_009029 [Puccinia striiformis f. sp. tritici PST-130]|nr:hypothetical protein H4Q26_009029 [Puccinia striiformis f. sp. tritici PST-130]